ncbi:MAG TPA: protein kinase family protein [Candidatus Mediterraneibacter ornithocaccae]|nr:protein kinase family protein [Candidatus Mediterraneibacter ornithocaccae]
MMCSVKTGKKIGDYTVASCIGKGRYGVCFLALDPDGKKVILKKFRTRMWKKNKNANHYEAVILSGLEHPAVPELLGVINNRQGYYFVLEYKEGLTLEQWLFDRKKIFTSGEIYRIGSQMFEVLEYLHGRNVVHGDISVANVTDDGEKISLLDFGLARYADGENIRFSLDYARAANVILYLLYSGYEGKDRRPWHEELPLTGEQREFLKKLLEPEEQFRDTGTVRHKFEKIF